jgi:hypothetical protein
MRTPSTSFSFFIRTVLALTLVLGMGFSPVLVGHAASAATATAHVVIQFAPGNTIVREIHFNGSSVSGLEALQLTGLPIGTETSTFGTMACTINGVGDCASYPDFWGYQNWSAGAWQDYMVGAGDSAVVDGGIEGWHWGEWGVSPIPDYPQLAATTALDWLRTQQNGTTGGYAAPQEALLAIGSAQSKAADWQLASGDPTLAAYIMANGYSLAVKGADSAGKLAAGLQAAGGCWLAAAPKPASFFNPSTGAYGAGTYGAGHQAWAILGEAALGEPIPAQAVDYLKGLAKSDGGWEWDASFGSDSNTTALVIQALLAGGEPASAAEIQAGLAFMKTVQNADGGFYYQDFNGQPADSDSNSTAYAIMAILAAGQEPSAWTKGSNDPVTFLLSQQLGDGSFQYQNAYPVSNIVATDQAITALLGKHYPLPGTSPAQCPTVFVPVVSR